ncbi:hypothetical protein DQ237_05855 [Blastococcus sp. TF02-8]|uniref:hypothetical protein n=1 Tax=Blastococcus sp. TF02-8 TaxID=2250574 RepID=UPI000DE887CA|nr:hypothetical protein [Blastococcus sp. TF02-8]RBY97367.1 hypothetical protein DQ237_05855 [Blastococcus sp. TF02-8]
MSTTRAARIAGGLLAAGVLLGGCSFSSENVSCSGTSCTATLSTDDAKAEVLGQTLTFGGIEDGRASLSVGGASVSCAEGEKVNAGPLELSCSGVTEDSVELTARLG